MTTGPVARICLIQIATSTVANPPTPTRWTHRRSRSEMSDAPSSIAYQIVGGTNSTSAVVISRYRGEVSRATSTSVFFERTSKKGWAKASPLSAKSWAHAPSSRRIVAPRSMKERQSTGRCVPPVLTCRCRRRPRAGSSRRSRRRSPARSRRPASRSRISCHHRLRPTAKPTKPGVRAATRSHASTRATGAPAPSTTRPAVRPSARAAAATSAAAAGSSMPSTFQSCGSRPAASSSVTARATSGGRAVRTNRSASPAVASWAGVGGTITSSMRTGPASGRRSRRATSAATEAALRGRVALGVVADERLDARRFEGEDAVDDPRVGEGEAVEAGGLHGDGHGPPGRHRVPGRSGAVLLVDQQAGARGVHAVGDGALEAVGDRALGRLDGRPVLRAGLLGAVEERAQVRSAVVAREHEPRSVGGRHRRRSVPVVRHAPIRGG